MRHYKLEILTSTDPITSEPGCGWLLNSDMECDDQAVVSVEAENMVNHQGDGTYSKYNLCLAHAMVELVAAARENE